MFFIHRLFIFKLLWWNLTLFQAQNDFFKFQKTHMGVKFNFGNIGINPNPLAQTIFELRLFEREAIACLSILCIFKPFYCNLISFQAQIWLLEVLKRPIWAAKFNFGNIGTNPNTVAQTVFELRLFE